MDDRELLELAAKAAGYVVRWDDDTLAYGPTFGIEVEPGNPCGFDPWNPLTDDGDALRLAVKTGAVIQPKWPGVEVWVFESRVSSGVVEYGDDQCAATRRAVVLAAAAIGRAM